MSEYFIIFTKPIFKSNVTIIYVNIHDRTWSPITAYCIRSLTLKSINQIFVPLSQCHRSHQLTNVYRLHYPKSITNHHDNNLKPHHSQPQRLATPPTSNFITSV